MLIVRDSVDSGCEYIFPRFETIRHGLASIGNIKILEVKQRRINAAGLGVPDLFPCCLPITRAVNLLVQSHRNAPTYLEQTRPSPFCISDSLLQEAFKLLAESWVRYNSDQGLTDDIRKIIRSAGTMGIPKEHIRGELSKLGRGIEDHVNPAGTVNSIVQRLLDKNEIEQIPDPLGLFAILRWKGDDYVALKAFMDAYAKTKKK